MKVIIPCAGKSSRFPNTRPKYMLTMPDGKLMLQHAARNWVDDYDVTFVINRQHDEDYGSERAIRRIYGDSVNVHILDEWTNGPAETIYQTIKDWDDTAFYVQDCDSHFDVQFNNHNVKNTVTYVNLHDYPETKNVAAKSFVTLHENLLKNIVEKHVASDKICIGGYRFASSGNYCYHYNRLKKALNSEELFISHVIKHMMNTGIIFTAQEAKNYVDCGTYESFIDIQRKHKTIFCDLDGVVFKNQSHYFDNHYGNAPKLKPNAVKHLLKQCEQGATIVFTTSRPTQYRKITTDALDAAGFCDYKLICDLPHAPRVLINDVSPTNPWPSAECINVKRDDDDFWK